MRPKGAKRGLDRAIGQIAARQHGVVSVKQLHAASADSSAIKRRVAAGRLHRVHQGVYAVGHPRLSDRGRWMAAVLACRDGAVLSHRSAGELWGIVRSSARRPPEAGGGEGSPVDVTVPGTGGRRRQRGIRIHRSSTLIPAECTRRDGIPVTNPARTLSDLARILSGTQFAAVLREAEFLRLPIRAAGEQARARQNVARTRTELEALFLAVVRRHRLPPPEVNVKIDRYEVDFLWRAERLIVEVDGWVAHRTRSAFEEDRARDTRLKLLGFDVFRFTWRQIEAEPKAVAATIRAVLRRAA
jgi:very-short-patch-repair endonuclease